MVLILAFEKFASERLRRILPGRYVHVELIVAYRERMCAYSTHVQGFFEGVNPELLDLSDEGFDFLMIPSTPWEDECILRTCDACSGSRLRYNMWDALLSSLPFRSPKDTHLFQADSLFSSQAVVLVLRECLRGDHPMYDTLQGVNSRTTGPTRLYKTALPFAVEIKHVGVNQSLWMRTPDMRVEC
jgi:hypothetical protein